MSIAESNFSPVLVVYLRMGHHTSNVIDALRVPRVPQLVGTGWADFACGAWERAPGAVGVVCLRLPGPPRRVFPLVRGMVSSVVACGSRWRNRDPLVCPGGLALVSKGRDGTGSTVPIAEDWRATARIVEGE